MTVAELRAVLDECADDAPVLMFTPTTSLSWDGQPKGGRSGGVKPWPAGVRSVRVEACHGVGLWRLSHNQDERDPASDTIALLVIP